MPTKRRILIQAGHLAPREPGHLAQTGTAGEQLLAVAIRDELVRLLRADGRFEPIAAPGDIPDGIKVDAALFLHADGSANPASSGYSFGYPGGYGTNIRLANLIDVEFRRIPHPAKRRQDNYTRDMAGYYGYSRVATSGPEVLVEHGFLSNPGERAWLVGHTKDLATAEYLALLAFWAMAVPAPKPTRDPLWARLRKAKFGAKSIQQILKALGR